MSVASALSLSRRAALGFVAMGILWGSFAAQVPVLKARIGADDGLFGLLLLGSPVGLMITMWLAPVFDHRLGRLSLPAAAGCVAAAYLLPGFATTPLAFLLAMFLLGLSSGTLDIVSNARVSELEATHRRPLMNANHGAFSVAYAISAIGTGFARDAGFAPAEIFTTLSLVVFALTLAMRMEVMPMDDTPDGDGRMPLAIVVLCGGIVLVAFFVEAVVESWSALHIERTLGGNPTEGAFGPAVLGLTMAVGRFSGQAVADILSDRVIIAGGSFVAAAGAVLAAVTPGPVFAYLGFGLMGLGVSVVAPLALAMAGRLVPSRQRAAAVARVNVIGFTAFLLAPAIMGQVSDAAGLRVAFAVVAVLTLTAPLLVRALMRRTGP